MKKTKLNLIRAYIEEILRRNQYELFANTADKQGYSFLSKYFKDMAEDERKHANWMYLTYQKITQNEQYDRVKVEIEIPTYYGVIVDVLKKIIIEKDKIWQEKYPTFEKMAENEGFPDIANILRETAYTEKQHATRLRSLLKIIRNNILFEKNLLIIWKCMECDFEIAMNELPEDFICPSCGHLKLYFKKNEFKLDRNDLFSMEREINIWVCMECSYEENSKELPKDWKCPICKRPSSYFKRKTIKLARDGAKSKIEHDTIWICMECGYEVEIYQLPNNWKCPKCNHPKSYFKMKTKVLEK